MYKARRSSPNQSHVFSIKNSARHRTSLARRKFAEFVQLLNLVSGVWGRQNWFSRAAVSGSVNVIRIYSPAGIKAGETLLFVLDGHTL